jgi:hypothetical protein
MFKIRRSSHPAENKGTEGNLQRNKRYGDLPHIHVVYSMKASIGLEIRGGHEPMDSVYSELEQLARSDK